MVQYNRIEIKYSVFSKIDLFSCSGKNMNAIFQSLKDLTSSTSVHIGITERSKCDSFQQLSNRFYPSSSSSSFSSLLNPHLIVCLY